MILPPPLVRSLVASPPVPSGPAPGVPAAPGVPSGPAPGVPAGPAPDLAGRRVRLLYFETAGAAVTQGGRTLLELIPLSREGVAAVVAERAGGAVTLDGHGLAEVLDEASAWPENWKLDPAGHALLSVPGTWEPTRFQEHWAESFGLMRSYLHEQAYAAVVVVSMRAATAHFDGITLLADNKDTYAWSLGHHLDRLVSEEVDRGRPVHPENHPDYSGALTLAQVPPRILPIPLPLDPPFPDPDYLRIGYTALLLPPAAIRVRTENRTESIPVMRNRGTLKRIAGPSPAQIEVEFQLIGTEMMDEVLAPLVAQFERTPFLPVSNDLLNDTHNVDALALSHLSVSTVEGQPQCLQVRLVAEPFLWAYYMPEETGSFSDTFCWPLFKLWCESRALDESGRAWREARAPWDGQIFFGTPRQGVIEQIELRDQPATANPRVARDAAWAGAVLAARQAPLRAPDPAGEPVTGGLFTDARGLWAVSRFYWIQNALLALPHAAAVYEAKPAVQASGAGDPRVVGTPATPHRVAEILAALRGPGSVAARAKILDSVWALLPGDGGFWPAIAGREAAMRDRAAEARETHDISRLTNDDFDWWNLSPESTITSISAEAANVLASLPVSGQPLPVHQFMGATDTYFTVQGMLVGKEDVATMRRMVERVAHLARIFRGGPGGIEYAGFLRVDNEIFRTMGVTHALPLQMQISTLDGLPDHYQLHLELASFDPSQRHVETLLEMGKAQNGLEGPTRGNPGTLAEAAKRIGVAHQNIADDHAHRVLRWQLFDERMKLQDLYPDMKLPPKTELDGWIKKLSEAPSDWTKALADPDLAPVVDWFDPAERVRMGPLLARLVPGANLFGWADPDFYCVPRCQTLARPMTPGERMTDLLLHLWGAPKGKDPTRNDYFHENSTDPADAGRAKLRLYDQHGRYADIRPGVLQDEASIAGYADDPENTQAIQADIGELKAWAAAHQERSQEDRALVSPALRAAPQEWGRAAQLHGAINVIADPERGYLTPIAAALQARMDAPGGPGSQYLSARILTDKTAQYIDPAFIMAVALRESDGGKLGDSRATYRTPNAWGAVGLLQIVAADHPGQDVVSDEGNIRVGVEMFTDSMSRYRNLATVAPLEAILLRHVLLPGTAKRLIQHPEYLEHPENRVDAFARKYVNDVLSMMYILRGQAGGPDASLSQAHDAAANKAAAARGQNPDRNDTTALVRAGAAKYRIPEILLQALVHVGGQDHRGGRPDDVITLAGLPRRDRPTAYEPAQPRYGLGLLPQAVAQALGGGGVGWQDPAASIDRAANLLSLCRPHPAYVPDVDQYTYWILGYLWGKARGKEDVWDWSEGHRASAGQARSPAQVAAYHLDLETFFLRQTRTQRDPTSGQVVPDASTRADPTPLPGYDPRSVFAFRSAYWDLCVQNQDGRLVRAYPTYLVQVVDGGRWLGFERLWDHVYGGFGVRSIQTVHTTEDPVDVCTIEFSNLYGNLTHLAADIEREGAGSIWDTRLQWSWEALVGGVEQVLSGAAGPDVERRWNLRLQSMMLKPGARLHVRLGYGNDASAVPVRFNGVIAEVPIQDGTIQVVALGDGVELTNRLNPSATTGDPVDPNNKDAVYINTGFLGDGKEPRNIILDLLTPRHTLIAGLTRGRFLADNEHGINHFGDLDYSPGKGILAIGTCETGVNVYDSSGKENNESGAWQNWYTCLGLAPWARGEICLGIKVPDSTGWKVVETIRGALPDYVCAVRPFETRSTLFVGKPWWTYYYRYGRWFGDPRETPQTMEDISAYMDYKAFSQMHLFCSEINLIATRIKASAQGVYNNVAATGSYAALVGSSLPLTEGTTMQADSDIFQEHQRRLVVESNLMSSTRQEFWDNIKESLLAVATFGAVTLKTPSRVLNNVAVQRLRDSLATMYQGDILLFGDPTIWPHDFAYLHDTATRTAGPVQVREVVHALSVDEGYVSVVRPGAVVCGAGSYQTQGVLGWMAVAERLCMIRGSAILGARLYRQLRHDRVEEELARIHPEAADPGFWLQFGEVGGAALGRAVAIRLLHMYAQPKLRRLRDGRIYAWAAARRARAGEALGRLADRATETAAGKAVEDILARTPLVDALAREKLLGRIQRALQKVRVPDLRPGIAALRGRQGAKAAARAVQESEPLIDGIAFGPLERQVLKLEITRLQAELAGAAADTPGDAARILALERQLGSAGERLKDAEGLRYFRNLARVREYAAEGGTLARLGRRLALGVEGGWVALAAEVVFQCFLSTIGDLFSRYVASRQAVVVLPLRHNGKELTAALNGHLGCVVGDPMSKMDEILMGLTNSEWSEQHWGPFGAVVPYLIGAFMPQVDGAARYDNQAESLGGVREATGARASEWASFPDYMDWLNHTAGDRSPDGAAPPGRPGTGRSRPSAATTGTSVPAGGTASPAGVLNNAIALARMPARMTRQTIVLRRAGLTFLSPVDGTTVGQFGAQRSTHVHAGVDIAAPEGTPMYAPADGDVSFAGPRDPRGYGFEIQIAHTGVDGTRYISLCAHCQDAVVEAGQHVRQGELIGHVGSRGHAKGPHVHFEIRGA